MNTEKFTKIVKLFTEFAKSEDLPEFIKALQKEDEATVYVDFDFSDIINRAYTLTPYITTLEAERFFNKHKKKLGDYSREAGIEYLDEQLSTDFHDAPDQSLADQEDEDEDEEEEEEEDEEEDEGLDHLHPNFRVRDEYE